MPDIAKCEGTGCSLRETCYRFTATPSEFRQSYFLNVPYNEETNSCEYEWKKI